MKKFICISLILLTFGVGIAAEILPIPFSFIGRWQPSEEPVLIDDYGLQDIQNLRKVGKHFKAIQGHTLINSTSISAAPYFLNGYHFRKDQPQESHVIVSAADSTSPTVSYLYQNTTAIPGTGDFSGTVLHTDAAGGIGNGRFSPAPAGNMVYSNGVETLIWGGNEIEATSFIVSSDSLSGTSSVLSNANDYSEQVRNTRNVAGQVAQVGSSTAATVKLLVHASEADGTAGTSIVDSSTTARTITAAGSAQVDTAQFKFSSGSVWFDGTGDYISAADHDDWTPGSDAFTIDFWVRFSAWSADESGYSYNGLTGQNADANNYWAFYIRRETATGACAATFRFKDGSTATIAVNMVAIPTLSLNTWYHIALIRGWGGGANTYAVTVNGTAYTATSSVAVPNIAAVLTIGQADWSVGARNLTGWIDEYRFTKGVAQWTANFVAPTAAYGTGGAYFLVGFTRPLQGIKLYVGNANTVTSTLTAKEFNGSSWTDLAVTDNTSAGGISLSQTGTVTWASTVSSSKVKYISGLSLYWYQFALSAGSATIYYCTVDAPIQAIKNIWNGRESYVSRAMKYNGSTYIDYTDEVNDDDSVNTYADFSSLTATTHYILLGFTEPMQGVNITFIAGKANGTSSTQLTASYWSGAAWSALSAASDGTATTTTSFNKNGVISWLPPSAGAEFPTTISDEIPLYYYKFVFAGNLDAEVQVGEIRGIMAPSEVPTYSFAESFRNRLFLFGEYNGLKNQAIYSQENSPDIFNGTDSGYLYFGDNTKVIAAAQVYNVFRTFAADQLIVMKEAETYRLAGDDPTTWQVQRMSANIGCVAPLSVVVCDAADAPEEGVKRQVVIWQSDKGFMLSDGAAIVPISNDIRCYFDPLDSRYIPTARRSKTVAWYDSSTRSYKALISSGSSARAHNIEIEYSLENKEWTKIIRANASGADPLQCGFSVYDTSGIGYTYGGNSGGFLFRLENGSTFNSTNIEQFLHTKDLILDTQAPMFRKSTVKYMRTLHKKKTAGGTIAIAHYGDQELTVNGTSNQVMPSSINMATAPYNTQSVALGPFLYHSFKFTLSGSSISGGMELDGLGLWVEPFTAIR